MTLLPSVRWVAHHCDDRVVILLIFVIQEYQLCPQVSLLSCPQYLETKHTQELTPNYIQTPSQHPLYIKTTCL